MTRRDELIAKLADEMDPENATRFVDDVIAEAITEWRSFKTIQVPPDFGLLTRRLIQRVATEWPHIASNALNDDIEAQLRQAWEDTKY